jgi:hypothetical protein
MKKTKKENCKEAAREAAYLLYFRSGHHFAASLHEIASYQYEWAQEGRTFMQTVIRRRMLEALARRRLITINPTPLIREKATMTEWGIMVHDVLFELGWEPT